eukprot:6671046-Prymnesium_polylepis.1
MGSIMVLTVCHNWVIRTAVPAIYLNRTAPCDGQARPSNLGDPRDGATCGESLQEGGADPGAAGDDKPTLS